MYKGVALQVIHFFSGNGYFKFIIRQSLFQATKEFIEAVNKCRAGRRAGPVSWSTAVKFLAARKFEVQRALALYEQHEATRRREGLAVLHPTQEPLLSELRTGKFTVLVRQESRLTRILLSSPIRLCSSRNDSIYEFCFSHRGMQQVQRLLFLQRIYIFHKTLHIRQLYK